MPKDLIRAIVHVKSLNRRAAVLYPGDDPGNWCVQLGTGECMTVSEEDIELMPQRSQRMHDNASARRPLFRLYGQPLHPTQGERRREKE
jgi:hypothetical protein